MFTKKGRETKEREEAVQALFVCPYLKNRPQEEKKCADLMVMPKKQSWPQQISHLSLFFTSQLVAQHS